MTPLKASGWRTHAQGMMDRKNSFRASAPPLNVNAATM